MKRKIKKKVTVLNSRVYRAVIAIPVAKTSQRDSMIQILDILYKLTYKQNALPGTYIEIPSNFWKKAVGEHYERALNRLKQANIVQSKESYSNYEESVFCKSYRINPNYIDESVETVSFTVPISQDGNHQKDLTEVARHTKRILRLAKLDIRAIKKDVKTYVRQRKFAHKLLIDGDIPGNHGIVVDCTAVPYLLDDSLTTTIENAIGWAKHFRLSLIKDKNQYIIDSVESYCNRKKNQIIRAYAYSIAQFQHGNYYAKRNPTNYRLDSNITSFPTALLGHITIDDSPFVSIDLVNSQFTILANLIEQGQTQPNTDIPIDLSLIIQTLSIQGFITVETYTESYSITPFTNRYIQHHTGTLAATHMCAIPIDETSRKTEGNALISYDYVPFSPDLRQFLELAKSGKIYDFIQEKLGLPNRSAAKILAFEIFFASYKYHGEAKRQLKVIFPTLIKIIDNYKKTHGSNEFAILLQKRESAIFIDRIMPRLIAKGYRVLSKHDSILCPIGEMTEVEAEMRAVLDEELGQYELKVSMADGTPIHKGTN